MMQELVSRKMDMTSDYEKEVLDVAAYAGHILLESGAEVFRVEETIEKIASAYGMSGAYKFVLSSGIFLTEEKSDKSFYARIEHIPLSSVNLGRVAAVNQLSREITEGKYTTKEAMERLKEISVDQKNNTLLTTVAYGIGSATFCYLFGGNLRDSLAAFITGIGLSMLLRLLAKRKKKTSKMVLNIFSGMYVASMCLLLLDLHVSVNLNHTVIGSIMPLLPGVAFTNAIRDFANEDYVSGTVRMVDAILVAVCIALGVGVVYNIYQNFNGGFLL